METEILEKRIKKVSEGKFFRTKYTVDRIVKQTEKNRNVCLSKDEKWFSDGRIMIPVSLFDRTFTDVKQKFDSDIITPEDEDEFTFIASRYDEEFDMAIYYYKGKEGIKKFQDGVLQPVANVYGLIKPPKILKGASNTEKPCNFYVDGELKAVVMPMRMNEGDFEYLKSKGIKE